LLLRSAEGKPFYASISHINVQFRPGLGKRSWTFRFSLLPGGCYRVSLAGEALEVCAVVVAVVPAQAPQGALRGGWSLPRWVVS